MLTASYTAIAIMDFDIAQMADSLHGFKSLCHSNPTLSYAVFSATLCAILFFGVPLASALMLLAGVLYSFWEAAALVTACRVGVAVSAFSISNKYLAPKYTGSSHKSKFIKNIETHPNISLLLMRLAPLPDSMVNYSMSAVPVKTRSYALISFIGMIPATLMLIIAGEKLGSLSNFINYMH